MSPPAEYRRLQSRHCGAAWAGGLIVTHLGLMQTPWIGALVVLVALALTELSGAWTAPLASMPAAAACRQVP